MILKHVGINFQVCTECGLTDKPKPGWSRYGLDYYCADCTAMKDKERDIIDEALADLEDTNGN